MANFKKLKLNTYLKKLGRFFDLILSDIAEFLTSLHKFSRAPENNSVFKVISSKSTSSAKGLTRVCTLKICNRASTSGGGT